MIKDTEKEKIIAVLGKQYSLKIIQQLEKKGIKPLRATVFTTKIIQNIINGHLEHEQVEIEILKLTKATARRKIKHENRLKSLQ